MEKQLTNFEYLKSLSKEEFIKEMKRHGFCTNLHYEKCAEIADCDKCIDMWMNSLIKEGGSQDND